MDFVHMIEHSSKHMYNISPTEGATLAVRTLPTITVIQPSRHPCHIAAHFFYCAAAAKRGNNPTYGALRH